LSNTSVVGTPLERQEATRDLAKLRNEELHDPYRSENNYEGDKIKEDEMGGACGTYGG
jgi:hypothetical protein